jgi:hypothetical protein
MATMQMKCQLQLMGLLNMMAQQDETDAANENNDDIEDEVIENALNQCLLYKDVMNSYITSDTIVAIMVWF